MTGEVMLSELRQRAARLVPPAGESDAGAFGITFAAEIAQWFSPHPADLGYYDDLLLVATQRGVGAAFCPHQGAFGKIERPLGKDARTLMVDHLCLELAALDAAFGSVPPGASPALSLTGTGPSAERGDLRGALIANELSRLGVTSVVMVGAVGSVLAELAARGMRVSAVDMDPAVIGESLGGVRVLAAVEGPPLVAQCDAAVITGMTLTTETFDELMRQARLSATKVVMFCQTGSNLGPELLSFGVSAVVAERFPFYMFPGMTQFRVFRRSQRRP